MWWIGPVAALAVLLGGPFVVWWLRRERKPVPVATFEPDTRPDEVRYGTYAAQLLDELNEYGIHVDVESRRPR